MKNIAFIRLSMAGLLIAWGGAFGNAKSNAEPEVARQVRFSSSAPIAPIGASDLEHARTEVRQAAARLNAILRRGPDDIRVGWHRYLRWPELESLLKGPKHPPAENVQDLGVRFFAGSRGLALTPFVELREALRAYYDVLSAADDQEFPDRVSAQVEKLDQLLTQYATSHRSDQAQQIGQSIGWLERMRRAGDTVANVRNEFSRPNFSVSATADFIASGLDAEIDDTQPIRDVILGTHLRGTAHTLGTLTTQLLPCDHEAQVKVMLQGTSESNNTGRNGPVRIHSLGHTTIAGQTTIHISDMGLEADSATACCSTKSKICSITACRRFGKQMIENIAWRRASKQKRRAESIAARHAEQRVARSINNRSGEFLGKANTRFRDGFRRPLARRRALPQDLNFSTTADALHVVALHALADQLGAPSAPPPVESSSRVLMQLHESFVRNVGEAVLSNVTLSDQRLHDLLVESEQPVPEELMLKEDEDPWSITFARFSPVSVRVEDNKIRIAIRGQKFKSGDQELNRLMEISANYSIEILDEGARLTRIGDVEVEFPKRKGARLGVSEVTFRTLMRTKFAALFKQEIAGKGIDLPGRWSERGKMHLTQLKSSDGWLALGWN